MGIRVRIITLEEQGKSNRYILYHEYTKGNKKYVLLILEKIYQEFSGCIFDESELKKILVLYQEVDQNYFKTFDKDITEEAYQSAIVYKKEV